MGERYPTFAEELDVKLTFADYDPKCFGDSTLIYDGPTTRLRIVRDRGQVFAEMSSADTPELWWRVNDLVRLTNAGPEMTGVTLDENVATLRRCYATLVRALGPDFADVRRAEEARKKAWIDNWNERVAELKHARIRESWLKRMLRRFRL